MTALQSFLRASRKPEVYPIVGILSLALSGAAFFGVHAIKAPDVVWYVIYISIYFDKQII